MLDVELQKIASKIITPRKRGRRKIELGPQRTLSPPLPLLERKVVHITHSALDFRGKKATPAQFKSPIHGNCATPYSRVLQAPVRNCLLRSLSRATKPNESSDSNSESGSSSTTLVFDYMNCNCKPDEDSGSLHFDSRFESGNLRKANRIAPRILKRKFPGNRLEECQPMNVDQEYDVWCNNDLHTRGNTQWFYFSAGEQRQKDNNSSDSDKPASSSKIRRSRLIVRKGMTVRFNIVNMRKSDSLCNFGMRPVVLSLNRLKESNKGWEHEGKNFRVKLYLPFVLPFLFFYLCNMMSDFFFIDLLIDLIFFCFYIYIYHLSSSQVKTYVTIAHQSRGKVVVVKIWREHPCTHCRSFTRSRVITILCILRTTTRTLFHVFNDSSIVSS